MKISKTVDDYFNNLTSYPEAQLKLREIILSTELSEELKWGIPCYSYNGNIVLGLSAFKSYFGIWFHQGALLTDPDNLLINAQEGTTKALRQWRMTDVSEINSKQILIFIHEAITNINEGKKIVANRNKPIVLPVELNDILNKNKSLKSAFDSLNLTHKRDFCEYISSPKKEATKLTRLEKIIPLILSGKGLYDKYKK